MLPAGSKANVVIVVVVVVVTVIVVVLCGMMINRFTPNNL
jgi:uncharacterized membrane protein AbrB (regulator of aidB expression)